MYDLILTRKAQRFYQQADQSLASRLNRCFDQLSKNPYQHPNIKPLKYYTLILHKFKAICIS